MLARFLDLLAGLQAQTPPDAEFLYDAATAGGALRLANLRRYLDRLQVDPAEVRALFDGLLVNVTAFFRDPAAWTVLRDELPGVLAQLDPDAPVRVWSAACATGI